MEQVRSRSPSSPSPERRAEARRLYETTGSISGASKGTGIARQTIRGWIASEGWVYHPPLQVVNEDGTAGNDRKSFQQRIESKVVEIATHEAYRRVEDSGIIEETANLTATIMREQGRLVLSITRSSQVVFDALEAGTLEPNQAIMYRTIIGGAVQGLAAGRDFAGLKSGQPTALPSTDASMPICIEQRRLETVTIPVDARGRKIDLPDEREAS